MMHRGNRTIGIVGVCCTLLVLYASLSHAEPEPLIDCTTDPQRYS
jgi:hypothetical protein